MDSPSQLLNNVQASLDLTMPWIGMYIAAASAVCTLAMAADAFIGFRSKKYWLPCKYFSLNAFSLILLTVAMKLPVDLTSLDLSFDHRFARMSSLVLMSCCMSNFMTSLGSMESTEIVPNMAALGILVITIAANVCIHIVQMRNFPITLKCHRDDIREREESVRQAAILLGESKKILQILQQRELPSLDVEKAAKIDEWRASLALDIENPLASASPSSSDNAIIE